MGDTGALSIGAGLAGLCLLMNLDLLLVVIGGLFVIETLSVIAQVISFRVFHRRVLRMAPLHHHFEMLGWPETTVLIRFWILAGLFAALGHRVVLRRLREDREGDLSDAPTRAHATRATSAARSRRAVAPAVAAPLARVADRRCSACCASSGS